MGLARHKGFEGEVGANVNRPVTPAMVSGWAPKTENINAAINDDSRISVTPYCSVVSIKSNAKAIPGSTLKE